MFHGYLFYIDIIKITMMPVMKNMVINKAIRRGDSFLALCFQLLAFCPRYSAHRLPDVQGQCAAPER